MQSDTVPPTAYDIDGQRWVKDTPGFTEAIARAFDQRLRPRCLCRRNPDGQGIEMYVARFMDSYIVKRMPETGSQHAPDCPSHEPPAEFSGLGQVLGSAITENLTTGETTLKLDFPLTKMPSRSQMPPAGGDSDSVATDGTKLSLRGLLHYLWDQAELTRWHPGFAGKRTWATVRRHLLQAAEHKLARGAALRVRLYVPEPFSIDKRDEINARRLAQWHNAMAAPGKPQQLMLLICEVKEIAAARFGFKAVVKHVPDQAFAVDEQLYRRLAGRFESELTLWGAAEDIHMVMVATFGVSGSGVPTIQELCLMPVTRHWLPVENEFEKQLLERLVSESRCFVKALHYNLGRRDSIASALLTDTSAPVELHVVAQDHDCSSPRTATDDKVASATQRWAWYPRLQSLPALPVKQAQMQPMCEVT